MAMLITGHGFFVLHAKNSADTLGLHQRDGPIGSVRPSSSVASTA
jgi:hypothetical protein